MRVYVHEPENDERRGGGATEEGSKSPEAMETFDSKVVERIPEDVALSKWQAAVGLKQKAGGTISDERFQVCCKSCWNVHGANCVR